MSVILSNTASISACCSVGGVNVVVVVDVDVDVAPVGRAAVAGTDERCLSRRDVTLAAPPLLWKPSNPWVDRSLPEWRDASELVSLSPTSQQSPEHPQALLLVLPSLEWLLLT
jgi:hypothetical protein